MKCTSLHWQLSAKKICKWNALYCTGNEVPKEIKFQKNGVWVKQWGVSKKMGKKNAVQEKKQGLKKMGSE